MRNVIAFAGVLATRRPVGSSLAPVLLPALAACGGTGTGTIDAPDAPPPTAPPTATTPDEPPVGGTPSAFAGSDAVTERFGTRTERELDPDVDEPVRAAVVDALNGFSLVLHRAVAATNPSEGSIESGYGAAVALSLASAATGGDTRTGLAALLGTDALAEDDVHAALNAIALELESRTNEDLVLRTANRLFVRPGLALRPAFLDTATADYGAPVTEADFANAPAEVADEVNGWVSDRTDGFIPAIIDTLSPTTVFALLNAIFLDAAWRDDYAALGDRPFLAASGETRSVPSFGGRSDLPRLVRGDLTALEIPYGGDELALLILMPTGLEAYEASLDGERLADVIDALEIADVDFAVPNWEDEAELDLVTLLGPLGLPANPWNFDRLVDGGTSLDVFARQRARIEVDENGTRAAAVTIIEADDSVPESIAIDRPFVYALRDRTTGTVLFTGRVVDP